MVRLRVRSLLIIAIVLLLVSQATSVVGLPNVLPPGKTVDVGDLGVTNQVPFAAAEGGLLVVPGSEVTLFANYAFSDSQGPAVGSQIHSATLRAYTSTGQIGSQTFFHTVSSPGGFSQSGLMALTIRVPEMVRGLTVELESALWQGDGVGSGLVGQATSSAPLSAVAVPEPVPFAQEDLVVADSLEAGTLTATQAGRSVTATDGHTFVSTDIGTRFLATAMVDRPQVGPASDVTFMVHATLGVNIEGGGSYAQSRAVFVDFCSDWNTHACGLAAASRVVDLEVVVPPSALGPHSVVSVNLHLNYEHNEYDAMTGSWVGTFDTLGDSGRHVVIGV